MIKKWIQIKNSGYRYKMFRVVLLFFFVLTVVLATYVIAVGHETKLKETKQRVELRTIQVQELIDLNLKNLERYYSVVAESKDIENILDNPTYYYDDLMTKRISQSFLGGSMYNELIDDFILLDANAMCVLGSDGVYRGNEYPGYEDLCKRLKMEYGHRTFWENVQEKELNYVMKLPLGSVHPDALAIISINTGQLKRLINETMMQKEHIFILNDNKEIVLYGSNKAEPELYLLLEEDFANKSSVHIPGVGTYQIGKRHSEEVNWTYVFLYKQPRVFEFNSVSTAIGALLILLVTGTVFLFSIYRVYHPVEQLIEKVGVPGKNADYDTELKYIEKKLTNLTTDADLLADTVKRQQERIQQMFELRLINDGIRSEEEWNVYFENLNLPEYERFATAVMVLDVRYNSKVQEGLNEDAICLQMIDDMPERARNLLWMPPVYNSCTIFSLIGANSEDELLGKINEYFEVMQEFSEQYTGFPIIMGVSGTHKDHKRIRLAYRESAMALMSNKKDDRDYHEIEAEVCEQGTDKTESLRYYVEKLPKEDKEHASSYEVKYENEVQIAIKEADVKRAYHATDRFAEYLLTVKTTDDALYQILRYTDRIVLTALEYNIPITEIFPRGMRTAYRELISELEPRRIRRYIKQYFIDPVISQINERMKQGSHLVMEQIDALLSETHGNMLLSECADRLKLNQNYIWKILKMERGKSFTEYAEKYKIEEAKKLLSETDLSVQEIAMKLDYANAQNFIRFFSKATGITPGKFRKMY